MKIVFLDFDGVLNSLSFCRAFPQRGLIGLDEVAVQRVRKICFRTGAKIVVSSSWRIIHALEDLQYRLGALGLPMDWVIGVTPKHLKSRGHEIQTWLDEHPEVTNFVILDDDSDMAHLMDRLIQTTFEDGLLEKHVKLAVEMLA